MQVEGYNTLKAIYGLNQNAKMIKVMYLVEEASSSYNIIIGRLAFNLLGAALSSLYICVNYLLLDGQVGVV